MKIRKISFSNHKFFGNLNLDFTDKNGRTVNTIIIAGENGVGKSYLLNTIFGLSASLNPLIKKNEKLLFEIELFEEEIEILKKSDYGIHFDKEIEDNIFEINLNYNEVDPIKRISIKAKRVNSRIFDFDSLLFSNNQTKNILRTIFSDVEINFNPDPIKTVTTSEIDNQDIGSVRSNNKLATEITQLLIDVQSSDALDFSEWARNNTGKIIDHDKIDVRLKRFTSAFEFMFPTKKYKKIKNVEKQKRIVFEEFGKEMGIEKLSSGEKQIVFRGSFLLKDKKSSMGALILIDEPEISLHPKWQLKVLSFFKKLFTDHEGNQTSQLIISTHSPFIIHNYNRNDDKVIVLNKDTNGLISALTEPKFYSWSTEKIVLEAFDIVHELDKNKITVFLEGETDEIYFNKCLKVFDKIKEQINFKWIGRTKKDGNAENTGKSALDLAQIFFTANMEFAKNNIILLYDNDTNKIENKIENLLICKMNLNIENIIYKRGIENLLTLIPEIDICKYYKEKSKKDEYSAESKYVTLDKKKLCKFICEELDSENQKIVLKKIDDEIIRLLEISE